MKYYTEKLYPFQDDNIQNILSNKISALPRLEIKDFVDIAFIAQAFPFSWKNLIDQTIKKDSWVNPVDISKLFKTIDPKLLKLIKWKNPVIINEIIKDFQIIAKDVLIGTDNSIKLLGSQRISISIK